MPFENPRSHLKPPALFPPESGTTSNGYPQHVRINRDLSGGIQRVAMKPRARFGQQQPHRAERADHEAGVRLRQVKSEEVDLALYAPDDADGFTKIGLGVPWRMHQRYEHLPSPASV